MVLERLREETSANHIRLEKKLNLFERIKTIDDYSHLLARFHGFYWPWIPKIPQIKFCETKEAMATKCVWLERDLEALGHDKDEISAIPNCPNLPETENEYQAIGSMYVVEGSNLGGQVITRHFEKLFENKVSFLAYFNSYGPQTGLRWKNFLAKLQQISDEAAIDQVILGASNTFSKLEAWLV